MLEQISLSDNVLSRGCRSSWSPPSPGFCKGFGPAFVPECSVPRAVCSWVQILTPATRSAITRTRSLELQSVPSVISPVTWLQKLGSAIKVADGGLLTTLYLELFVVRRWQALCNRVGVVCFDIGLELLI